MKCLVTGVAGFVGSTLAENLLNAGHSVVGIDSFTDYYDPRLKHRNVHPIQDRIELIQGDLNTLDLEEVLAGGVEYVFHQAGQPGVRKSWGRDFSAYLDANVAATQRLLESAVAVGSLKRFVYASSSSVYGNAQRYPTAETALPHPMSPYGVTKLAAEHLCSLYAQNHGLPTVSLRYFTVYGPKQRPDMAFTRFLTAAVRGDRLQIFGDGNQIRDFTFVDDVVRANLLAAFTDGLEPGLVMNVAGGTSITVNEVIECIRAQLDKTVEVDRVDSVRGDVFRTGGDARLLRTLGWTPKTAVEEGIARQLDWVRSELVAPAGEYS